MQNHSFANIRVNHITIKASEHIGHNIVISHWGECNYKASKYAINQTKPYAKLANNYDSYWKTVQQDQNTKLLEGSSSIGSIFNAPGRTKLQQLPNSIWKWHP